MNVILIIYIYICICYSLPIAENISKDTTDIIEIGLPRTGTTLQFEIVCLMSYYYFLQYDKSVICDMCYAPDRNRGETDVRVCKMHRLNESNTSYFRSLKTVSIFTTEMDYNVLFDDENDANVFKKAVFSSNKTEVMDITMSDLVYKYNTIFNLSKNLLDNIIEYLDSWTILRRCCGTQLSSSYRMQIKKKFYYGDKNKLVHFCDNYNITDYAISFMQSKLFTELNIDPHLYIMAKPAFTDPTPFKYDYCIAYNSGIIKDELHFNEGGDYDVLNDYMLYNIRNVYIIIGTHDISTKLTEKIAIKLSKKLNIDIDIDNISLNNTINSYITSDLLKHGYYILQIDYDYIHLNLGMLNKIFTGDNVKYIIETNINDISNLINNIIKEEKNHLFLWDQKLLDNQIIQYEQYLYNFLEIFTEK